MGRAMLIGTLVLLLGLAMVLGSSLTGQQAVAEGDEEEQGEAPGYLDDYIELLRADVRWGRRDIIIANMEFTEKESTAFWPLYRKYEFEMGVIGDERLALLKEYVAKGGVLTADEARQMLQKSFELQERQLKVRAEYAPEFEKVLPIHKVVRFYHVNRAIDAVIDVVIAAEMPLAHEE